MQNEWLNQLWMLCFNVLVSLPIWRYYDGRTVAASERYSTFAPRLWAGFVDGLVLWPVSAVFAIALSSPLPLVLLVVLHCVQGLPTTFYTIWMHYAYGRTIGKVVTHVRVVDVHSEGPISQRQAVVRDGIPLVMAVGMWIYEVPRFFDGSLGVSPDNFAKAVANDPGMRVLILIPILWFTAELLSMRMNDKRRALHDLIAGTVVVRTNTAPAAPQP